jgi:hypothetical protein
MVPMITTRSGKERAMKKTDDNKGISMMPGMMYGALKRKRIEPVPMIILRMLKI